MIILLAALLIRTPPFLFRELSNDEIEDIYTNSVLMFYEGEHPPLYYALLEYLTRNLTWKQDWLIRLPSLIFGMGIVLLSYKLGLMLGNRRSALWAAAVAGFNPLLIGFSATLRSYSMDVFLLLAMTIFFVRIQQYKDNNVPGKLYTGWILFALAGSWSHYANMFVSIMQPVAGWLYSEGDKRRSWLVWGGIFLAGCAPLIIVLTLNPMIEHLVTGDFHTFLDQPRYFQKTTVYSESNLYLVKAVAESLPGLLYRPELFEYRDFWPWAGQYVLPLAILLYFFKNFQGPIWLKPMILLCIAAPLTGNLVFSAMTLLNAGILSFFPYQISVIIPFIAVAMALCIKSGIIKWLLVIHLLICVGETGFWVSKFRNMNQVSTAMAFVADAEKEGDVLVVNKPAWRARRFSPLIKPRWYYSGNLEFLEAPEFPNPEIFEDYNRIWVLEEKQHTRLMTNFAIPEADNADSENTAYSHALTYRERMLRQGRHFSEWINSEYPLVKTGYFSVEPEIQLKLFDKAADVSVDEVNMYVNDRIESSLSILEVAMNWTRMALAQLALLAGLLFLLYPGLVSAGNASGTCEKSGV